MSNELPLISDGHGIMRKLAALKPPLEAMSNAKLFAEAFPVDPSKWKECDYSFYNSPIRNQGQTGSCTGHAGVTALDYSRRMEGQEPVLLSCTFPYGLVNGGVDQGASVTSVLRVLQQVGTCLESEVPEGTIFQQQFPPTAWNTAGNYKVKEAYLLRTYEEVCEAVNRGFIPVFGISVGSNFSQLSQDGVCPLPRTVIGGHALPGVGLKQSRTASWLLKFQNSWGKAWGLKGFAFLTRGHFDNLIDAYAVQYAQVIDGPPVVPAKESMPEVIKPEEPVKLEVTTEEPKSPEMTTVTHEESLMSQMEPETKPTETEDTAQASKKKNKHKH